MSEGLNQITIPEFDEEEFTSPAVPFGRSANAFGFGASSGADSPTLSTPNAGPERDHFHSRHDSVASEDSSFSLHAPSASFAARSNASTSLAHASQTSTPSANASTSTNTSAAPFTKKSSFASLRNAFKSASGGGKSADAAPPVPALAYPALRNPFSRSTSSLAHHTPSPSLRSPPSAHGRAMSLRSKNQGHAYGRSQHSHTGSIFHNSDAGSDYALGFNHIILRQSTPPPVPRVPNEYGGPARAQVYDSPPASDAEDRVVMDPRTPSEYALHAIFMRFAALAEDKLERFLKQPLELEPSLTDFLGPKVDSKFDDLLTSLGCIATKSTKPVVDSIMRWRKSQRESVSSDVKHVHSSSSSAYARSMRPSEMANMLNERKSLASIYIMCRALIAVVQSVPRDALSDSLGFTLEEITFDQFRRPDLKLLAQSLNHRTNAELYAILLGKLSNIRFMSVTDRFLAELAPVASNQIPKDMDAKYENLVRALKHVEIKVWPPEAFEEGTEFIEAFAKSFEHAHGSRLKIAFAETLVRLLHPIGKTAQAEVNHPLWAKAIEVIYPKARDMMGKPRYWQVAYPLVVTSLCVAPQEYFLRNWIACFEAGFPKLKEKPFRVTVMNGMMRLISTILKHFFPPSHEHLEPLYYIVHFILSRHFDLGCELVLNLMQEQQISSAQAQTGNISLSLAPERTSIAMEAKEESTPTWPSNWDFTVLPDKEDYPALATFCSPTLKPKPGMKDFSDRCGATLASSVGRMSIFDDQWALLRMNASGYEDNHPEVNVAYPSALSAQISMLHTCFSAWPRCLHPSLPLDDVLDMLIRSIIHVEPSLGEAASGALQRITEDPAHLPRVLSRFAIFLFSPKQFIAEALGTRLPFESTRLLNVWFGIVEAWARGIMERASGVFDESDSTWVNTQFFDVETAALFLLSSRSRAARTVGVKLLRVLENIYTTFLEKPTTPLNELSDNAFRILGILLDKDKPQMYLEGLDDLLDSKQQDRLAQWRQSALGDVLLRLAASEDERDRCLWWLVYPAIIRSQVIYQSKVILSCREMWVAATIRYHSAVLSTSGINNRTPAPQGSRGPALSVRDREKAIADNLPMIEQWHMWVKLTCCTAVPPESKASTHHTRAPSDVLPDRDLVSTNTRGLFRYLIPFLDSDYSVFRDIAVLCISSFPVNAYRDLLDDLGMFSARHFYVDTSRIKMSPTSMSRRNRRQDRLYLAVAHIYQLTAHYLKDQRGVGRQDSLTNVLKFVRITQAYLSNPEIRSDWQQQRLRRYFCGISSDRFIPAQTHLTLYRLCEEWCQCGSQSERVKQRLITMQIAATAGFPEPQQKAGAIAQFQTETRLLSHAAAGAMASLCQKAFFPPDLSSGSPTDRLSSDFLVPLEVAPTLDRLVAMLATMHDAVKAYGRKALRSIVDHTGGGETFLDEVLRRSFVTSVDPETSSYRFFEIVADVICTGESCQLTFGHVICLGISNLCSPLVDTRRLALAALEAVNTKTGGKTSLSCYEASVGSSAANIYLDAQFQISHLLAREHPDEAVNVIVHCASKLPMVYDVLAAYAFSHILNGLSPWFASVNLLVKDNSSLTREGRVVLYHLLSLTLRYSETYPEQVYALWKWLVNDCHPNGHATIRFLLEHSSKVGSSGFVSCARKVVACLSRTTCGRQIFEELCEVIEPIRMLPTIDHKLMFPDAEETDLWSDLDALFAEQPKHSLGSGQFALLFLGDVALPRAWEFRKQLPNVLHGIFTHIGHRNPFVQEQARRMFFQVLRAWLPGYDELSGRPSLPPLAMMKSAVTELERESSSIFWTEDDTISQISDKMGHLCSLALQWLEPLYPALADEWGSLSLLWGTSCSIRPIAFRSLQIFRSLMPRVTQADLAQLLGRLSNTIAALEPNLHPFTVELILTLRSVAKSGKLDSELLPQVYWCAVSCLSTPVEAEFLELIDLLECLLDRLDLSDPYIAEVLIANRPADFNDGSSGLQPLLLVGLRSAKTFDHTFKVLKRLSEIEDSTLIDSSGNRVRDMYTLILPWCLRSMEENKMDDLIVDYANNVSRFAEDEDRSSIARIMTSFARSRFRTKDDFMRQAAAALREHYAPHYWAEVVSLLMSLVLNQERWLQVKSMQFLKVLFQLRETRNPVDRLGSELLMPLLRLLQTDLAPQALEVLEEPIAISGGLAAKHVLRMSMHVSSVLQVDVDAVTEVFGMPEDSGWSIARPERQREICRANVMTVFDTCKVPTRPSRIDFEPEGDRFADPLEADLGDLVQNLHELSTFFLGDPDADDQLQPPMARALHPPPSLSLPNQQFEARVAAILAKSTDTTGTHDSPETPFADVFRVNRTNGATDNLRHGFDGSDEDSDSSEFDMDTFAFDSFTNMSSDGGHKNGFLKHQH
ncbi:cell morphogenesis N-terminal-domain-containing protein [Phellopilus nigrolimitatus]|nr:cell morphogenesis N-terminal-domain-containing protein [Phellopilus nigrolimitatus]